ncbi:MAG TPA: sigma 54-interacting transcriptional regulator, partial [Polyangiales bacterium]|nr:sigma 54-interacting transcriptional regulator [Polyangiales bacterium]
IVLHDDTVSRRHCEIELSETGFRVRDLGSTNGVRSAGLRVFDIACSEPAELALGESTLSITPLAQTEDRERVTSQSFGDVLGGSPKIRELFAELERFANTQLSMLIEGETGSGKDVVAESIHRASARAEGPYVVFDCSAVAPTLIESELFGHERGAFTGAINARAGVFEQAHGGTLFLDEIGELPKDLQPKLLRALERREVKRLGSHKVETVDVRVLAATNRNLAAEVKTGNFRQDLFYRIAGARVHVPPLRERLEDLPLLVEHFLRLDAPHVAHFNVPSHVWDMFRAHRWPGNVRELRSAVQRLVVAPELALHASDRVQCESAPQPTAAGASSIAPLRIARREAADNFERDYLRALLARTQGNISRAAAIAEVSRQMVQKLLKKHELDDGS